MEKPVGVINCRGSVYGEPHRHHNVPNKYANNEHYITLSKITIQHLKDKSSHSLDFLEKNLQVT